MPQDEKRDSQSLSKEIGVAVFLLIVGWIGGAIIEDWLADRVIHGRTLVLLLLLLTLLYLIYLGHASLRVMNRLDRRIGIKVRYIENDGSGRVYYSCRKVILKARKSIHILNSYLVEGHSDSEKPARAAYYDLLLQQAGTTVDYIRLQQVKADGSTLRELGDDPVHAQHLKKMIDRRNGGHGRNIILKRCLARRLTTFVLIDNVHLIWQINNVSFDGKQERMALQGVFIIHDPQGKITGQFESIFETLLMGDNSDLRWDPATLSFA